MQNLESILEKLTKMVLNIIYEVHLLAQHRKLIKSYEFLHFCFLNTKYIKKKSSHDQDEIAVAVQRVDLAIKSAKEFKSFAINLKETGQKKRRQIFNILEINIQYPGDRAVKWSVTNWTISILGSNGWSILDNGPNKCARPIETMSK